MPTTTKGLRYPASSAAPNVPQDFQNLASDVDARLPGVWTYIVNSSSYSTPPAASWATLPSCTGSVVVPSGRELTVQFRAPAVNVTGGIVNVRLVVGGTNYDGAVYSIGSGTAWWPARHEAQVIGTGVSVSFSVQAQLTSGSGSIQAASVGNVIFRYRIQ